MEQPYDSIPSTADTCGAQQQSDHKSNSSCNSNPSRHIRHSTHSQNITCRLFSFLVILHTFQAICCTAQATAAASGPGRPCVACDDCVTSSCLRICRPSCRTAPAMAEGSDLSTEQCKHKGQEAALDIATAACKLSQVGARLC